MFRRIGLHLSFPDGVGLYQFALAETQLGNERKRKKKKVLVLNPAKLNPRHWQRWRVRTILGSPRIVGDRIHCMGELVKAKRGFCSPKEVLPRSRGSPPTRTAIKRPCLLPTSHVLSGKKHTVPRRQTLNPVSHRPSLCQDL